MRLLPKIFVAVVALGLAAYVAAHVRTQSLLKVSSDVRFAAPGPGDPVEGARIASVVGCNGCHGTDLGGKPFMRMPYVYRLVAPDLTRARERYDDAALVRLFRTGAKADGYIALGMPHRAQQRLTDREVADLIAYLRSAPKAAESVDGETAIYPVGRIAGALGKFPIPSGDPPESAAVLQERNSKDLGFHLAQIACAECHGADLNGHAAGAVPPLIVAKAYTPEQFANLMKTGKTPAGIDTASGLMSRMARERFHQLTDQELAGLHASLVAR